MVLHENSEKGESFPNGFTLSQSTIPFPFVLLEFAFPVASYLRTVQTGKKESEVLQSIAF